MDFSLDSLGGFAKDVASATSTVKNAFKDDEPDDRKTAKALGAMNWQTIGLALGGVLAVALILKIAFRR